MLPSRQRSTDPAEPVRSADVVYHVDGDGRILDVAGPWDAFAGENGAPGLTREAVLGCPVWEFMSGAATRHLFRALFDRARTVRPVSVPIRCDGPAFRRYIHVRISRVEGTDDRLEVRCVLERSEAREPVAPWAWGPGVGEDAPGEIVRMCGWCNRIHADGRWLEIEAGLEALGAFEGEEPPRVSHGICPDCRARVDEELDRGALEAPAPAS